MQRFTKFTPANDHHLNTDVRKASPPGNRSHSISESSAIVEFSAKSNSAKKSQVFQPVVLIASTLAVLSTGTGLMIFSPGTNGKNVSSSSPRGGVIANPQIAPNGSKDNNSYAEAIALANKATLMAAKDKGELDRKEIAVLWDKAIDKLKKIDKQSIDYQKAQGKITEWQVIENIYRKNRIAQ